MKFESQPEETRLFVLVGAFLVLIGIIAYRPDLLSVILTLGGAFKWLNR